MQSSVKRIVRLLCILVVGNILHTDVCSGLLGDLESNIGTTHAVGATVSVSGNAEYASATANVVVYLNSTIINVVNIRTTGVTRNPQTTSYGSRVSVTTDVITANTVVKIIVTINLLQEDNNLVVTFRNDPVNHRADFPLDVRYGNRNFFLPDASALSGENPSFGDTVLFSCNNTRFVSQNFTAVVQSNAQWNPISHPCRPITCTTTLDCDNCAFNDTSSGDVLSLGVSRTASCQPGTTSGGQNPLTLTCTHDSGNLVFNLNCTDVSDCKDVCHRLDDGKIGAAILGPIYLVIFLVLILASCCILEPEPLDHPSSVTKDTAASVPSIAITYNSGKVVKYTLKCKTEGYTQSTSSAVVAESMIKMNFFGKLTWPASKDGQAYVVIVLRGRVVINETIVTSTSYRHWMASVSKYTYIILPIGDGGDIGQPTKHLVDKKAYHKSCLALLLLLVSLILIIVGVLLLALFPQTNCCQADCDPCVFSGAGIGGLVVGILADLIVVGLFVWMLVETCCSRCCSTCRCHCCCCYCCIPDAEEGKSGNSVNTSNGTA